jgi:hypothetical protein
MSAVEPAAGQSTMPTPATYGFHIASVTDAQMTGSSGPHPHWMGVEVKMENSRMVRCGPYPVNPSGTSL